MEIEDFREGWNVGFDDGIDFIKTFMRSDDFNLLIKEKDIDPKVISIVLDLLKTGKDS